MAVKDANKGPPPCSPRVLLRQGIATRNVAPPHGKLPPSTGRYYVGLTAGTTPFTSPGVGVQAITGRGPEAEAAEHPGSVEQRDILAGFQVFEDLGVVGGQRCVVTFAWRCIHEVGTG